MSQAAFKAQVTDEAEQLDEAGMNECEYEHYVAEQLEERQYERHGVPRDTKWDASEGYDFNDPKHPTYAERMADIFDSREK